MGVASASTQGPGGELRFFAGLAGALTPFVVFLAGVLMLTTSGIGDERAFWPVLVVALIVGLGLARDRTLYSKTVIQGMAQPIVMIMLMAWWLASILGEILNATDFVRSLTWLAGSAGVGGVSFVIVAFLICCVVSTSTGTSFGTILICGPILYPTGGLLGSHLPTLAGAVIGGATFGDSISPLSDTSIASAFSQHADIGGTVRSRIKYVVLAAAIGMVMYAISAVAGGGTLSNEPQVVEGGAKSLPMILAPLFVIVVLLQGRHLLEGLLGGIVAATAIGLGFGLLKTSDLMSIGPNRAIHSVVIDGIDRALGITVFTVLLVGLVATLKASGVMKRLVDFSASRVHTIRAAEFWIVGTVMLTVLIIQQAIVAMLTVAEFTRETGKRFGIHAYRRANLLDLTVSTFPFIVPYSLPVILMAGTTSSGAAHGIPPASAAIVGLHNFHSWAVLVVVIFAVASGFGRRLLADEAAQTVSTDTDIAVTAEEAGVDTP